MPQPLRIGINGFGRIGRLALRVLASRTDLPLAIVAVNDLSPPDSLAHLLAFDSTYGPLKKEVTAKEHSFLVEGIEGEVHCFSSRNPEDIPWADAGVDVVLECTGLFTSREGASRHLSGEKGAKKVVISAPAKGEVDGTFVMGVNDAELRPNEHNIVSNASCTTNSLAPVASVLHREFGIEEGLVTTVHSYTGDQRILDGSHRDLRRARSAAENIIPTTTGAARAVGLVIPELAGKLNGLALRVPTPAVSVTDLVCRLARPASAEAVNEALKNAAQSPELRGRLSVEARPLVSRDFLQCPSSSIVDLPSTITLPGGLIKVLCWYDNEWGYANRLVELAARFATDNA